MSGPLRLLLFLTVRARYRRIRRGLATLRGVLLMLFGLGFFAAIAITPRVTPHMPDLGPNPLQRFGPAGLLAFAFLSIFASTKYRGVYFSPAEVEFLFPAPFSRRQLLAYRLGTQCVHTLLSVVFTSVLLCSYAFLHGFWQTAIGLFLAFTFINLVQVAGSLVAGTLEERVVARGRRFILGVLVVFAVVVFGASSAALEGGEEFRESIREFLGSPALGWALLPMKTFSETLTARSTQSFFLWAGGGLLVDITLLALVLRLDVDYSEASLETSRRLHQRIQELRRGGRPVASLKKLRLSLPLPPAMKGLGPVAWRQAQEMVRETPGAAYLLTVFAVGAILPLLLFSSGDRELREAHLAKTLTGLTIALPFILSNWFRFDFRGDLERMELLLSLPVPPALVAFGQLIVPALVLTALQGTGLLAILAFFPEPEDGFLRPLLLACFPLNLLFVAIENFFFLVLPVRPMAAAPGDFQALGKVILALVVKTLVLLAVVVIGLSLAYLAYLIDRSLSLGVLVFISFLLLVAGGAVVLVGWTFSRFDVSRPPPE